MGNGPNGETMTTPEKDKTAAIKVTGGGRNVFFECNLEASIGYDFDRTRENRVIGGGFSGENLARLSDSSDNIFARVGMFESGSALPRDREKQEAFDEMLASIKEAKSPEDAIDRAQSSGFGRWLKDQKFVEWAALVRRYLPDDFWAGFN